MWIPSIFFQAPRADEPRPALNPAGWVASHGDVMYRYTLVRVGSDDIAENLVQETFLAALKSKDSFSGRSSERTWLMGILKHKMLDHYRRRGREVATEDIDDAPDPTDDLFDAKGHWAIGPSHWTDPEGSLEKEAFWEVLSECTEKLPDRLKTCFTLREVDGVPGAEVCKVMGISETNLWVMIHRARARLRRCIELGWFEPAGEEAIS